MARRAKGNTVAQEGNVTADYGIRAATALDSLVPGPHRDKNVARLFGVSVRQAKYLRTGRHWTVDRLTQASAMLGTAFDAALYSPASSAQHYSEMADIEDRLARLEARIAEVDRGANAGLAAQEGEAIRDEGRQVAEPVRALGREVA